MWQKKGTVGMKLFLGYQHMKNLVWAKCITSCKVAFKKMVDLQTQGAIKEKSVRKTERLQNGNNALPFKFKCTTIFSDWSGIFRNKKAILHDNKDQKAKSVAF